MLQITSVFIFLRKLLVSPNRQVFILRKFITVIITYILSPSWAPQIFRLYVGRSKPCSDRLTRIKLPTNACFYVLLSVVTNNMSIFNHLLPFFGRRSQSLRSSRSLSRLLILLRHFCFGTQSPLRLRENSGRRGHMNNGNARLEYIRSDRNYKNVKKCFFHADHHSVRDVFNCFQQIYENIFTLLFFKRD